MTPKPQSWKEKYRDELMEIGRRYKNRSEAREGYYPHFWTEGVAMEELEAFIEEAVAAVREEAVRGERERCVDIAMEYAHGCVGSACGCGDYCPSDDRASLAKDIADSLNQP